MKLVLIHIGPLHMSVEKDGVSLLTDGRLTLVAHLGARTVSASSVARPTGRSGSHNGRKPDTA